MYTVKKGMKVYVLKGQNLGNKPGTLTKVVATRNIDGISLFPFVYCEAIDPVEGIKHNIYVNNKHVVLEHVDRLLPKNIEINAKIKL